MRITGGRYSGRRIACPKGVIRPAMDRMRESMFSILGDISGDSFLDLFSGSGVVGIEAASRGAEPVVLVEKDRRKRRTVEENTSFVETDIRVVSMAAEQYLSRLSQRFDLIHLDPPFKYGKKTALLQLVSDNSALEDGGLCMLHLPAKEELPERIGGLQRIDRRTYGGSALLFYRPPE
jgi:16S rRNA (guanine(966)-N(2))-methyltransferase RsmD